MAEMKSCQTCGQAFPASTEFWHRSGRGLQSRCKECACARAREWYTSHPKRVRINHRNSSSRRSAQGAERRRKREAAYVAPAHRICNVCRQEFPRTEEFWHKQPRARDGLSETCKGCAARRTRAWYAANRARVRERVNEYRQQNPELIRGQKRQSRQRNIEKVLAADRAWKAANVAKRVAYTAQWRLDNPEKAAALRKREYENNKELVKQRAHDWVQANPERVKLRTARRRAAQKGAPGHFTEADLVRQFEKQQGRCFYCHEDLQRVGTIDHYIPLSKGGTNYPSNIVLACWPCNNSKRAKFPSEFRPRR